MEWEEWGNDMKLSLEKDKRQESVIRIKSRYLCQHSYSGVRINHGNDENALSVIESLILNGFILFCVSLSSLWG